MMIATKYVHMFQVVRIVRMTRTAGRSVLMTRRAPLIVSSPTCLAITDVQDARQTARASPDSTMEAQAAALTQGLQTTGRKLTIALKILLTQGLRSRFCRP